MAYNPGMMLKETALSFLSDNLTLHGVLHLPDTKRPPLVIGSHGLEGTRESAKQRVLADILPPCGIAFFRFDHRGCGQSQGEFTRDTSLDKRARDMVQAVQHVLSLDVTDKRFALFGSSLGGATCIESWHRLENLGLKPEGTVICAAPVKSRTIENIPLDATDDRPALPLSFFETNLLFDVSGKASLLENILIFHGDRDEIVPVDNARMIYAAAREPRRMIIQKGGGHRMDDPSHQKEFEREAAAWFKRCFGLM